MTLKYESEILYKLMERDGFNIPSSVPPYESEIKAYLIDQVKQAYPKLTDYEAEWLLYNYTQHLPAEFPISSVSDVTKATFENVVPFAYQSAILKGQTLVNISPFKTQTFVSNGNTYVGKSHYFNKDKTPIKKGKYTISFEVTSSQPTTDCAYWVNLYNNGSTSHNVKVDNTSTYGKFVVVLEVSKETNQIGFFATPNTSNITFVIDSVIVIEGDYTNVDIPYFEGMQSVKMPVLTTTGKNLFDGKLEYGLLSNKDGRPLNSNDYVRTQNFIPINCEKITFTVINGECGLSFYYYDKDKNFISNKVKTKVSDDLSMPEDAAYLKFRSYPISDESITNNLNTQIQIEQGSTATPYEPYKSNILTVNEDVTLRGIGDVKDELNLLTGELTQRIGEVVLDGSENWLYSGDHVSNEEYAVYHSSKITVPINPSSIGISNNIPYDKEAVSPSIFGRECLYINSSYQCCYIRIKRDKLTNTSFSQWLSQNPITVQYQLAENTTKTVDLTTVNEKGETSYFMPLEGTMNVQSSGEIIQPTFDMSVPVEATTQNLASFIDLEME